MHMDIQVSLSVSHLYLILNTADKYDSVQLVRFIYGIIRSSGQLRTSVYF
jgi:hypothetical protein